MKTRGTPQTLTEAIQNGLDDVKPGTNPVDRIRLHVKDFLAQKFSLIDMTPMTLWNKIFPEDPR